MVASIRSSEFHKPASAPGDRIDRAAISRQEALHDGGLVRRFNDGDEGAFVEIIARHREKMFYLALSLVRNRPDAEEVAQDTFIRAYRNLARFRGDCALATWLHHIALNLARNRYVHMERRRQLATYSFDGAFSEDNQATLAHLIASEEPSPAREAENGEFSELVARCMERLGPAGREVLMQLNTLDRTYEEIARSLGVNVSTVKSRIKRARRSFRAQFAKTCPEYARVPTRDETAFCS
jgi:RNA polymerase sigma-70 factor (ECF subfamily)